LAKQNGKIPSMNVSSSKIGHNLKNNVVQKLKQENNVFTQKWSNKLIFLNRKKIIIDVKAKSILT
jgi:hypothetical protein